VERAYLVDLSKVIDEMNHLARQAKDVPAGTPEVVAFIVRTFEDFTSAHAGDSILICAGILAATTFAAMCWWRVVAVQNQGERGAHRGE
jgi:hypothetical protein